MLQKKNLSLGKKRDISNDSVKKMQSATFPDTFSSYDIENDRVLITPHGPDPVFYGVRGETIKSVVRASTIVNSDEKIRWIHGFQIKSRDGRPSK